MKMKRGSTENIWVERPLHLQETRQFWQDMLKQEVEHNMYTKMIKDQKEELKDLCQMEWEN